MLNIHNNCRLNVSGIEHFCMHKISTIFLLNLMVLHLPWQVSQVLFFKQNSSRGTWMDKSLLFFSVVHHVVTCHM